jgi:hypothetical protein
MIILVIFCNPISDLEFFFHLNDQLGFGSLYTKKKAATFNLPWVTNADFKLDSFALLVQLELEFNVNSSNFMVVHCLPCNYRIYIVFVPTSTCCKIFRQK